MLHRSERILDNIPVGSLGIIAVDGCEEMGNKVNDYLVKWRKEETRFQKDNLVFNGYEKPNYLINAKVPRFGSGEAKGIINESVRGKDLYLMVDVCNYSLTYSLSGNTNHMSPDDHFQNLKRVIAAVGGKARRLNVIMPFLYESRQHKRSGRESLDCALGLQELVRMGVDNIITFDAHDPRVQNAIPLNGFETIRPTYQFVKGLLKHVPDLQIDADHMMAISPDEGATGRAIYFANVLGLDMGMFYKRRDYTTIVDGRNPIVAHEFLGSSVEGKDVIILDDMISSGDSILDVVPVWIRLDRLNLRDAVLAHAGECKLVEIFKVNHTGRHVPLRLLALRYFLPFTVTSNAPDFCAVTKALENALFSAALRFLLDWSRNFRM